MKIPLILGLSASLRNARSREGCKALVQDLIGCKDRPALYAYLAGQGNAHLEQYYQAGRDNGVPYDQLYKALRQMGGKRGLSNSEVCLAAALWGAAQEGSEIDQIPLADHFKADGTVAGIDELRELLIKADGILIATPVYFGDRSSLSQNFIEMIRSDPELQARLKGKIYGGLSVGAKRNGGQETTLIYQMHDMMDLGLLGVGNDFETTSQYGGTGHAGDVGTMPKDEYGLGTCVGTGRRVARVAGFMLAANDYCLSDRLRLGVWVMQDKNESLTSILEPFLEPLYASANITVTIMHEQDILPCLACDICPSRVGLDEEFRCIRGKSDAMHALHAQMLQTDVIIPAMFSPKDRDGLVSVYQQFLERTRYLRRGDYAFTDRLIAPLVIGEIGTNENLNLRMTTSLIRHHTVMQKPVMGWVHKGTLLNPEDIVSGLQCAMAYGQRLLTGRLAMTAQGSPIALYKPVGYVLSLTKDNMPETMTKREEAIHIRLKKLLAESTQRIVALEP